MGESPDLIEALAAKSHESWSRWMAYVFAVSETRSDGAVVIPRGLVVRWRRQMATAYAELSEREKQSDRLEARRILPLLRRE